MIRLHRKARRAPQWKKTGERKSYWEGSKECTELANMQMVFPKHTRQGNKTDCPERSIKARTQMKLSLDIKKNIQGDGTLLSAWSPFDPLDAGKKGLEQNTNYVQIIWNARWF